MHNSQTGRIAPPAGLLGPQDGPAVKVLNNASRAPLVLVCDHASNAVPASLNRLGLDDAAFDEHIALDIGAAELTTRLSALLDCAAVMCQYSRLVVDCNRYLADPSAFQEFSDGVEVHGNRALTQAQKDARVAAIRTPYHGAIDQALAARSSNGQAPGVIAIHSFTPVMNEFQRPWHVGVLWDRDHRLAHPMLDHLSRDNGLCVGDNEPYSGREPADYTVDHHGERRGRPCVSLEIRQDLLLDGAGLAFWSERIGAVLQEVLSRPEIFRPREIGNGESAKY